MIYELILNNRRVILDNQHGDFWIPHFFFTAQLHEIWKFNSEENEVFVSWKSVRYFSISREARNIDYAFKFEQLIEIVHNEPR